MGVGRFSARFKRRANVLNFALLLRERPQLRDEILDLHADAFALVRKRDPHGDNDIEGPTLLPPRARVAGDSGPVAVAPFLPDSTACEREIAPSPAF